MDWVGGVGRNQAVLDRDGNDLCGRFDPGMVETKIDGANQRKFSMRRKKKWEENKYEI